MATRKKPLDFEANLAQLEDIVETLEDGNLSLEESLKSFELGIKITRQCQEALKQAEQRVLLLSQDAEGKIQETPFVDTDTDDE
ncbi:MAG: exodeoxyribonuclease VII small subunit [Porticoccaceae bacterium]|nr:exodeoxyribonuclease VII small subunit [Porticoccaceae bacterium]